MTEDLAEADVVAGYRSLVNAFSHLEQAKEFAAAVHVAAAIDVLEHRLGTVRQRHKGAAPTDHTATFVKRMAETFGTSAEAVARRQLGAACGLPLLAWANIVNQLCERRGLS